MKIEQLIQKLATLLSGEMPCFYHNISPILASCCISQTLPYPQDEYKQACQTILDGLAVNPTQETAILNELCDLAQKSFLQNILCAYFQMKVQSTNVDAKKFDKYIQQTIQSIPQPIIINFGVDMYMLANSSKLLHQQGDEWYIGQNKIFEVQPIIFPRNLDGTLLIVARRDAPFLDFNRMYNKILTSTDAIKTNDVYTSLELSTQTLANPAIDRYETHIIVRSLIPLLYNPQAAVYMSKININYDEIM